MSKNERRRESREREPVIFTGLSLNLWSVTKLHMHRVRLQGFAEMRSLEPMSQIKIPVITQSYETLESGHWECKDAFEYP